MKDTSRISSSPKVSPRARQAYFLWIAGRKIKDISKDFNVHRKTVSRWIKQIEGTKEIDIDEDSYQKIVYDLLDIHGNARKLNLIALLNCIKTEDKQGVYDCQRQATAERKKIDKLIERLGLKFKSDLQQENAKLKTLCAWALTYAYRLLENNDALENKEHPIWETPHIVSLEEINKLRSCPELLQIERYINDTDNLFANIPYRDCVDLEVLTLVRSHLDPLYDPFKH